MLRRRLIILAVASLLCLGAGFFLFGRRTPTLAVAPPQAPVLGTFPVPAPVSPRAKQLRRVLVDALGLGAPLPWDHRTELIRSLPNDLNPDETNAMLVAMMERCPPNLSHTVHAAYMHEIACRLQPRREVREAFARALAALARDHDQDEITRDYAVQHLRQVWAHAGDDPALRTLVLSTFREFTKLDAVLVGPALLSLHVLGSDSADFPLNAPRPNQVPAVVPPIPGSSATPSFLVPDSDLVPLLQPILASKPGKANVEARLTAVRIVGERRLADFRPQLLAALSDPEEHTLIRMAAIHGLGQISHPSDLKVLAEFKPVDDRLRIALELALKSRPISR